MSDGQRCEVIASRRQSGDDWVEFGNAEEGSGLDAMMRTIYACGDEGELHRLDRSAEVEIGPQARQSMEESSPGL